MTARQPTVWVYKDVLPTALHRVMTGVDMLTWKREINTKTIKKETRCKGRSHMGATRQHGVVTLNVGGSREALTNAMDLEVQVLLIQEHRIA